jgi:hypothetical protein
VQRLSEQKHFPAVSFIEQAKNAQQGAFALAGRPDEYNFLPCGDGAGDLLKNDSIRNRGYRFA